MIFCDFSNQWVAVECACGREWLHGSVQGVKTTPVELTEEAKQALPFRDTISKRDVDKCPDASISYCFSCLLLLAHENNPAILGEA